MNRIFLGLQDSELIVNLGNVIVFATDLEEHKKVTRLLERLLEAKLCLQPDKCEFLTTKVE